MADNFQRRFSRRARRGATVVELALMLPLFLLMAMGAIEFGRALMVEQMIVNASREGGRFAVLPGSTTTEVTTQVKNYLSTGRINPTVVSVTFPSTDLATAKTGTEVSVKVDVAYKDVAWLPHPWFMKNTTLSCTTTMRHE